MQVDKSNLNQARPTIESRPVFIALTKKWASFLLLERAYAVQAVVNEGYSYREIAAHLRAAGIKVEESTIRRDSKIARLRESYKQKIREHESIAAVLEEAEANDGFETPVADCESEAARLAYVHLVSEAASALPTPPVAAQVNTSTSVFQKVPRGPLGLGGEPVDPVRHASLLDQIERANNCGRDVEERRLRDLSYKNQQLVREFGTDDRNKVLEIRVARANDSGRQEEEQRRRERAERQALRARKSGK